MSHVCYRQVLLGFEKSYRARLNLNIAWIYSFLKFYADIPTSVQLWEFTLRVLKKPAYHYIVNWEDRKEGLFRFYNPEAFAALWGRHKNRPNMTFDKIARAFRFYYDKRDILNPVGGRRRYRFAKRLHKSFEVTDEEESVPASSSLQDDNMDHTVENNEVLNLITIVDSMSCP